MSLYRRPSRSRKPMMVDIASPNGETAAYMVRTHKQADKLVDRITRQDPRVVIHLQFDAGYLCLYDGRLR